MQLKFFLRAVANSIITHRMHCTDVSDDEILKFLLDEAFQSEAEAREKIIRTKQSNTQLSTYFVGRTAMYNLRQQIEREMGDKFDLGRYHEAVMSVGSVPVKYLPELVRAAEKLMIVPGALSGSLFDMSLTAVLFFHVLHTG